MTAETCKLRLELAKKRNDKKEIEFWEKRLARKISRFPKYAHLRVEEPITKSKKGK